MDEVSIPVSLLEEMRDTATSAYYFSQMTDLHDHYRAMKTGKPKLSKMTEALNSSVEICDTFITLAKEQDEDESSSDTD